LKTQGFFVFGPFRLDPPERLLLRERQPIPLPPKAFDLLVVLVSHAGHLVTKEQLLQDVWPGTFVEEANLSYTVSLVRKALGDDKEPHRYIDTVPRAGYRFREPVGNLTDPGAQSPDGIAGPAMVGRAGHPGLWTEPGIAESSPNGAGVAPAGAIPTRLWRWALAGTVLATIASLLAMPRPWLPWRGPARAVSAPAIATLAVLPLRNLTGDSAQDYFVDGMTEAITTTLSQISVLGVTSSTSAMGYRHTTKAPPEIARELGVDALIEGHVLKSGNRVTVTVALIRSTSHRRAWTRTYEQKLEDIFVLYRDVGQAVAQEMKVTLTSRDLERLGRSHAVKPEAYEAYLRGAHLERRWMSGGCIEAERYLLRAVELDQDFAPPYADLAWCNLVPDRLQRPATEIAPKARSYAARAVALDPFFARPHVVLGLISHRIDFDWNAAGLSFRRALELEVNDIDAQYAYGEYLYLSGQIDEGLALAEKAFTAGFR
jgi:DNA-binding winged helix-turn-helix (wHTH) protein/TolB-like protein